MDVGWNKHFGIPTTTWVDLLVLEPRLGETLWTPWWVELLVLELGWKNDLEP